MYTIGRLAHRAKVNVDSIRFYERQGLLFSETKTDFGYRLYTDDALRRIKFIKHAQRCGFSLAEIGALLEMHKQDRVSRVGAYHLAARKQAEIRQTIEAMEGMSKALATLLAERTDEFGAVAMQADESPILRALESGDFPKRAKCDREMPNALKTDDKADDLRASFALSTSF